MDIPVRPKVIRKSSLKKEQMDCLSYYVIFKTSKGEAYRRFIHPELLVTPMVLNQQAEQLFGTKDAKEYIKDFEQTIAEFIDANKIKPKNDEERKAINEKRISAMEEKALQIIEDNLNNPSEALEAVKIYFKEFREKEEEIAEELPRRYLPTTCSMCRYKIFAENETVDECLKCKFKKYANENGVHYDPTKQLEK